MDLARIKDCATALLYTDIHPTPFSPLVVHHPFTASGVTAIHDENGELAYNGNRLNSSNTSDNMKI